MACQTLNFWGTVTKITKNILKAKSYQTGRVRTVRTPIGIHAQNAFVKNLATNIWYKIVFQGPDMGSLKKVLMNASDVPPARACVCPCSGSCSCWYEIPREVRNYPAPAYHPARLPAAAASAVATTTIGGGPGKSCHLFRLRHNMLRMRNHLHPCDTQLLRPRQRRQRRQRRQQRVL